MRWKYWDVLAMAAGAVLIALTIVAETGGLHHGGMAIYAGSAGSVIWLAAWLCVGVFAICAVTGWRGGNRWLIGVGAMLLAISAAPSLLLLIACLSGDCL